MKVKFRSVYIGAAFLSIVLYMLGIATGIYARNMLTNEIENVTTEIESNIDYIRKDLKNIQEEYILLGLRGEESCDILSHVLSDTTRNLNSAVNELIRLDATERDEKAYAELKKDYTLLTIKAWTLRSTLNENCAQKVLPVLYFYSVPCNNCVEQGKVIDELKSVHKNNVSFYVLDKDFDHPLIKILVESLNVKSAPAIVINSVNYGDLSEKQTLNKVVCSILNATC